MLIALVLMAMQATTQSAPPRVPAFEPPYWRSPPPADAASRYSPRFANSIGVEGYVLLVCEVERVGPPDTCEVASESPTGLGYGAAALKIAQLGVLEPRHVDGKPSRGSLMFGLPFLPQTPVPAPSRPYKGPAPSDLALIIGRAEARDGLVEFRRQMEVDFYGGLDPDRIAVVRPWVEELFPVDEARFVEDIGLAYARIYAMTDMEGRMIRGEPVPNLDQDAMQALMDSATSDIQRPKDAAAIAELRRRYCRAFDCEVRRRARD